MFQINRSTPEIKDEHQYKNEVKDIPDYILNEYATIVSIETEGEFEGRVFETINEETDEITYALYIIASRFGDIMYRLIEVKQQNIAQLFPVTVEFNTINMEGDESAICYTPAELRAKLKNHAESKYTGEVLGYLDRLVKIKTYERSKSA